MVLYALRGYRHANTLHAYVVCERDIMQSNHLTIAFQDRSNHLSSLMPCCCCWFLQPKRSHKKYFDISFSESPKWQPQNILWVELACFCMEHSLYSEVFWKSCFLFFVFYFGCESVLKIIGTPILAVCIGNKAKEGACLFWTKCWSVHLLFRSPWLRHLDVCMQVIKVVSSSFFPLIIHAVSPFWCEKTCSVNNTPGLTHFLSKKDQRVLRSSVQLK